MSKNILVKIIMEYRDEKDVKGYTKYLGNHYKIEKTSEGNLKNIVFNKNVNKKGLLLLNENFEIIENKKIDDTAIKKVYIENEDKLKNFIKSNLKNEVISKREQEEEEME